MSKRKVIYYLNQFFGQIGGEESANIPPRFIEGGIGPSLVFSNQVDNINLGRLFVEITILTKTKKVFLSF